MPSGIGQPLSIVNLIDPSEHLRPELKFAAKALECFRDYSIDENNPIKERVRKTYLEMHTNQTMHFVTDRIQQWTSFSTFKSGIMDALEKLNNLVDESDPDNSIPNIVHAFQTAERIRLEHPDDDWFHLTGLIHDLGKVMAFYDEPQWAVVGDTFPVGCQHAPSIVYRDTSFVNNPDTYDERYNTKFGIYEEHCGLSNVTMSWGHDEFLYRVLVHNKTTLPEQALYMIRFHSFYPWHSGGDYHHLCDKKDLEMLPWIREFNKYDLYTKSHEIPDIVALKPYYQKLIDKYIPGELEW
ncbi:inositol oxygenase [Folsomia candida]|uniref:Inositol oxygenase n=1 Tax=Folsomia candida TaxID=158441 RepID=A0A226EW93_FOLCA|nr:inositol oxygenase [Folsomia candida]OXA61111.1 Inositol oxygenase [Folsomia candida]